jgi:hypothetical protein
MSQIGTLTGTGRVHVDGKFIGGAYYDIEVRKPRFVIEADGTIKAERATITKIRDAGGADLELEDGGKIRILVQRWNLMDERADVAVSGPIPGF